MSTNTIVQLRPLYVSKPEAARYLALSETGFERLVAAGDIAKQRKLSAGRAAWLVSDLDAYGLSRPVSDLLPPENSGKRKEIAA